MKALAHMALDRLPDWKGHAHAPQLTAELQRRVWGADGAEGGGGFRARLPACWEANERVLDRLLRLPELTVGLPLPVSLPVPGPAPVSGEEGESEEGSASAAPPRDDSSAGNSSSSDSPGSGGGSAGGGYSDGVQVLTHLLRDWAAEGAELRRRTYGPILRAVRRLVQPQPQREQGEGGGGGNGARILVPGAGLGRLAFELAYGYGGSSSTTAGRAYRVTALDVSPVMVAAAASVLALLREQGPEQGEGGDDHRHQELTFFPFVHDPLINQRSHAARFRPVAAPDPAARRQARQRASSSASSSLSSLSLEVGDLLAHAAARPQGYDAVVTCFLIDTGQTPLDYLWAIKQLLRPGGHWINLGPLNYHKQLPEGAVQLTLEDLEWAAAAMGLVPQPGWALVPEPCAYRPEPFAGSEGEGGDGGGIPAFLRRDVYHPAFGVYRREE